LKRWSFVTRLVICAAVLSWSPATNAQSRAPIQTDAPVLFKADQLRNEQKIGLIVATGNVEFSQNGRTLLADSVSYNQRTDTVTANGNISLLEPSGEVLFADHIELTDSMRDGIVENMRVRLTDNSRIAAVGGRRIGGQRTEFRKAVYSPCKLCEEDPTRAPIWQVKAFKVTHDQETKDVTYRDAYLEFYGIPIMYTPFLSHPDPTVERRTGLLAPTYGSDSDLGTTISTPYYIDIAPNMDATLTPLVTTGEGIVGSGEFRHRLSASAYKLSGSLTHGSPDDGGGDEFRGHIKGDLRHEFDRTWRGGADLHLATDDTYLRRYNFDSPDTLENRVFAEGFRGRNYASANAYYFQGQRVTDDQGDTPIVFPNLDINYVSEPARHGGLWKLDADILALSRTDGTDTRRLSAKTKWELPYISRLGEVYRVFASLQTDAYWVDELAERDSPTNNISGVSGRVFPQAGMEWRLPFARKEDRFTQVVEPIFSVILAPNGQNRERIPNEDSQSFEFDDTNLFSENRFGGIDRVEGGPRVTYGLNSGVFGLNSGFSSFFIGQSYRLIDDDDFGEGTGLEDHFSDIVGRVEISPTRYLNALYRFRLDKNGFSPKRNELEATIGVNALRLNVNYLSLDQQNLSDILDPEDEFRDREEITFGFTSQVTDRWRFGANTRRDLTSGGGSLRHGAFLNYEDECFHFQVDYARTFTRDRDIQPSDTIMFRVVFKTLGEVTTSTGAN
jgi:LPS-assembly protein